MRRHVWKEGVLPPHQTSSDEPVQDLCPEGCTCGSGVPHLRKGVWRKTSHSGSTHFISWCCKALPTLPVLSRLRLPYLQPCRCCASS